MAWTRVVRHTLPVPITKISCLKASNVPQVPIRACHKVGESKRRRGKGQKPQNEHPLNHVHIMSMIVISVGNIHAICAGLQEGGE